jgi:hypothetical protein
VRTHHVDPLQQRDRLRAQLRVEQAVVLLRQLPRPLVELGVADLAVLRLLRRLQVGQLGAPGRLGVQTARTPAQRRADERDDRQHHREDDQQLHRYCVVRASSRATRAA